MGLSSFLLVLFITEEDASSLWGKATSASVRLTTGELSPTFGVDNMAANTTAVDLGWYAPAQTLVNNLTNVVSSSTTGVYGFIYNSSYTSNEEYGTYNWCNMPHVRATEYVVPDDDYELVYVELVCPESLSRISRISRTNLSSLTIH